MAKTHVLDIEPFIENAEGAVRYYSIIALAVFGFGLAIAISTFFPGLKSITQDISIVAKIGGCFIAALSTLAIKQMQERRENLRVLAALKKLISSDPSEEDLLWITELVRDMYKKGAIAG